MKNITKIATLISLSSLSLFSCTTNPYTGERQISKGALYGGLGAGAGALAGQLAGGNTKSTLIGAGIGAAAGGGYGLYRDSQEKQLRVALQGTGVQIVRDGENTKLIMPSNITFDSNRNEIKSSFYSVLNSVAIVLKKYDKTKIVVGGHTDSTGNADFNQILSQKRAESVATYLSSQGVALSRIASYGYGATRPVDSNSTTSGKENNRRVEISLVPMNTTF